VERGWLEEGYVDAIERGHAGLSRMISLKGEVENVCPGTSTQSSEQAYFNRGPLRNDAHGIGPVLLGTYAVMHLQTITE
jgi:hypothetical protein